MKLTREATLAIYLSHVKSGLTPEKAAVETSNTDGVTSSVESILRYARDKHLLVSETVRAKIESLTQTRTLKDNVTVTSFAPQMEFTPEDIWTQAENGNERRGVDEEAQRHVLVEFTDGLPVGIAWISDHHLDDPRARLTLARQDALTIRDTEGLYLGVGGDDLNWYIEHKDRYPKFDDPTLPLFQRRMLFDHWMNMVGAKTLFALAGNHNFYLYGKSGFLYERDTVKAWDIHYSKDYVLPQFVVGDQQYLGYFTHTHFGKSRLNPILELLRAARHAPSPQRPDIIGVGHRHDPCVAYTWLDGKPISLMKSGSYKPIAADFEGQHNIAESGDDMPMAIFLPDVHEIHLCRSIQWGASVLRQKRQEYRNKMRAHLLTREKIAC